MKTILTLSILFSLMALPLRAADTDETGTIETDIAVIKTALQNLNEKIDDKLSGLEKSFDSRFSGLEKSFDSRFSGLEKNFDNRFDNIEKNFDRQNTLIIACIAIPMALITLMIAWRSVKDNSLQKQIDALTEIIESQKQQLTEKPQA